MKSLNAFLLLLMSACIGTAAGLPELDPDFRPYFTTTRGTAVHDVHVLPDGRYLVAGVFNSANGVRSDGIARFNADGTLDETFRPAAGGRVTSMEVQPDGKVLLAGSVGATINGVSRNGIIRLNQDGSVDETFSNGTGGSGINHVSLHADGKIVVGGIFSTINGIERRALARLDSDGALDVSFNAQLPPGSSITALLALTDGKLMVAGGSPSLARLNIDGSVDQTFSFTSPHRVNALKLQPDGKLLIAGAFNPLSDPTAKGVIRINTNGSLDQGFSAHVPGNFNPEVYSLDVFPDGGIVVGGRFGSTSGPNTSLHKMSSDGSLDSSFEVETVGVIYSVAALGDGSVMAGGTRPGPDASRNLLKRFSPSGLLDQDFKASVGDLASVFKFELSPEGKIYVGGNFVEVNGREHQSIARLHRNGTLDVSFAAVTANGGVHGLAVQPDGKVLIAGDFGALNGQPRGRIARLDRDGSLDETFQVDAGADTAINDVVLQPDGKILIGGIFTTYAEVARRSIARLNSDGSLDLTFDIGTPGPSNGVARILLLPDEKILITGYFENIGGVRVSGIARLHPDGRRDLTFNPGGAGAGGPGVPQYWIDGLAVEPDGKILVGGYFLTFNGVPRLGFARLNSDGTLDAPLNAQPQTVLEIVTLPNGGILMSGVPQSSGNAPRGRISVLTRDGTAEATFDAGPYEYIYAIERQSSDEILVAGNFSQINGFRHSGMARFGRAPQSVTVSGRVVSPGGLAQRNAAVSISDSSGTRRSATTSSFGTFEFIDIPVGQGYTLTVASKRYRFPARILDLEDNLSGLTLVGSE